MRISVLTMGSRGDVQFYLPPALGLQQAGHQVRFASHESFRELITGCGLDFAPLEGNPFELMQGEAGQRYLASNRNPIQMLRQINRMFAPALARYLADCWEACREAEAIFYSRVAFAGVHIAERLGVPCYIGSHTPMTATRAFPHPLTAAGPRLGGLYNRLTYALLEEFVWQMVRGSINRWRREVLDLPNRPFFGGFKVEHRLPWLYGLSPSVIPRPTDWPDWAHLTGYWFVESPDWQPPKELADFLVAGPPPVYIGFGGTTISEPEAMTQLILDAVAQAGQRAVLLAGWAGLGEIDLPAEVFRIHEVPFDWLFPRMAAVVHHGGGGSTAFGLRAGTPTIIVPFMSESFYWGQRIAELGVGPPPIPYKELTAEKLAAAIRTAVSDEDMRARVAALGAKIRAEDGAARAVELFHHYLSRDRSKV